MKMTRIEKSLVNRPAKGAANAKRIEAQLAPLAMRPAAKVLELGCGIADVGAFLATRRGFHVIATDADPEQVELARRRHSATPQLELEVADAARLRFAPASFDLVVSQNVFHHIPDWPAAVLEISRVLRPGGYLLWLDLTAPAPLKLLLRPLRSQMGLYTVEEVRDAFRSAGLVEEQVRKLGPGFRYELTLQKATGRANPQVLDAIGSS